MPVSNYLTRVIFYLDRIGVTDVIIPFLLLFSVVYVALQKSKVFAFGTSKESTSRKFSAIIALSLSSGVVISHVTRNFGYTRGLDVITVINQAIPRVSIVLVAILFFLIMLGIWGWESPQNDNFSGGIVILSLLVISYIFASAAGFLPRGPGTILYILGPDVTSLVVVVLVFGAVVWFITSEDKADNSASKGFADFIKIFKPGR